MEYDEYYKLFKTFFRGKNFKEIFEEGSKMLKALFDAEQHAAADAWYGEDDRSK